MSKALCCEFCGKILKLTINLERHMKTFHLANLSLMRKAPCCEFCGKNLKSTINSERQMITVYLANLSFMSKTLESVMDLSTFNMFCIKLEENIVRKNCTKT